MSLLTPTLPTVREWIGDDMVQAVDRFRRARKELKRDRQLSTAATIWLMLAVSLENHRKNLEEILAIAYHDLGGEAVTVSAFCQGRMRFSPQGNEAPAGVDYCHCGRPGIQ